MMMMMIIETSAVGAAAAAATGDDHHAAVGVGILHNNRPAREPLPIRAINSSAHYTAAIAS